MADGQHRDDSAMELEKELTCAICTDIIYQPLTLLDCLHTFCGSCLKEWFKWQARAVSSNARRAAGVYTCPSCRDVVRGTKADWRMTTLVEGFLRAHPDRAKSETEKEEMRKIYKPGESVLPQLDARRAEDDEEDERLLSEVRELSLAESASATRRTGRPRGAWSEGGPENTDHRRTRHGHRSEVEGHHQNDERRRRRTELTQERLRQHDAHEPVVEHQPSLRSLLSASPVTSQDVQQEILQSIYADGLLDGIDIDNLTPEQEDQLTERIADAYRRRQNRGGASRPRPTSRSRHSPPRPVTSGADRGARHHTRSGSASSQQPRPRPPISRPHLFEQANHGDSSAQRPRSASAATQRRELSTLLTLDPATAPPASRSATDLTERIHTEDVSRQSQIVLTSGTRSNTEPVTGHAEAHRLREASTSSQERRQTEIFSGRAPAQARSPPAAANADAPSLFIPPPSNDTLNSTIRPSPSKSIFAPEPIPAAVVQSRMRQMKCDRCGKPNIEHELHYHCPWCRNGSYNICIRCYRSSRGCEHWYGFGYRAHEAWRNETPPGGYASGAERPHILVPRKVLASSANEPPETREGAFCECCHSYTDERYWYCFDCLDGAWGFCDSCVHRGRHCTHPLMPVAHLRTLRQSYHDPATAVILQMPHLKQDSYVFRPEPLGCVECRRLVAPGEIRFHCYECYNGYYDVCMPCYNHFVAIGKISQHDGPQGWRRCFQGHRVAMITEQELPSGATRRVTLQPPVGGWRFKGDVSSSNPPPIDSYLGAQYVALYNYFRGDEMPDELSFPRNADITEVEELAEGWSVGVYMGRVGLFSSNYVRELPTDLAIT